MVMRLAVTEANPSLRPPKEVRRVSQGTALTSQRVRAGKTKSKFEQRIPKEIRDAGGTATTPDGAPICFDFAFERCRETVAEGSRCKKGYRLCCICYGPHSMADHKKH